MNTRTGLASVAGVVACGVVVLGGCAPAEQAVWVPASGVETAVVFRDAHFAITPAEGTQTLLYEREVGGDGRLPGVERWVVEIPANAEIGQTIEVGQAFGLDALVFERADEGEAASRRGRVQERRKRSALLLGEREASRSLTSESIRARTYAAPLEGYVTVVEKGESTLTATLTLIGPTQLRDAGVDEQLQPLLAETIVFDRAIATAVAPAQLYNRAGVPTTPQDQDPYELP